MEKNPSPAGGQEKFKSRYDRKMEARRLKEEQERRQERLFRGVALAVVVCLVAIAAYFGFTSVANRKAAFKDPYLTVGSHTLTKLEYDYYLNSAKSSYVSSYGSFLSALGVDMSQDLSKQPYLGSETMSWKDYFDQSAVDQIKWTKALNDDAAAGGFSYEGAEEDYSQFWAGVNSSAQAGNMQPKQFIRRQFGPYASQKAIEPFVREGLLAAAYYQDLLDRNQPDGEEIKARYEENTKDYDSVDYRSFTFTADLDEYAPEEEIASAMEELKGKAEQMKGRLEAGEDFNELCAEYAGEDIADTYRESDTASLTEGASYASAGSSYSEWLYEDGRKEGDLTAAADDTAHTYTVVEFVKRYYDDAKDAEIGDTIAGERAQEYVSGLTEGYEVTDLKEDLTYLRETEAQQEETGDKETAADGMGAEETAADGAGTEETAADASAAKETTAAGTEAE